MAAYPPQLKEKSIASNLWLAEFSIAQAAKYAERGDSYAVAGALTRTASFLTQVLFALNETYFISDKTALAELEAGFQALRPQVPPEYAQRLRKALGQVYETPVELTASTNAVRDLWASVAAVSKDGGIEYRPFFTLV